MDSYFSLTNLEHDEEITCTSERAFKRLSNLQFLKIHGDGINPLSLNYISRKLKVLVWPMFPMSCFPSRFNPEFLVVLRMKNSSLEKLWEGNKPLKNLRYMDLSNSESLKELPDLSTATNLYDLDLAFCSRLLKLPSSIGNAFRLKTLSLHYCSSLVELPFSIGNATNLQMLTLTFCSSLTALPSMINLARLSSLGLCRCSKLEVVLANINLESLENLDLSDCSMLKSYTESSTVQELDPWIGRMSSLNTLIIKGMKKLVSLPPLPDSLLYLNAENCQSLEILDCSFRNPDICLNFTKCYKLNQEARDLIIHTPTNEYAIFPGEEVPMCFTYRSSGSSVTVKLNQMPLCKSTKFKACIVFYGLDDTYWGSVCCTITSGRNSLTYWNKTVEVFFVQHLLTFDVEVETEEVTSTELLFDFDISYECTSKFKRMKIKECGIFQLPERSLY